MSESGKKPDNLRPLAYVLIKKYGLKGALRILHEDIFFDFRQGVNTAMPVPRSRLYKKGLRDNQNRYVASTFGVLDAVLSFAEDRMNLSECGFVDLGSGKGKALIGATRYPFRSLRGVDVSPLMHKVACKNIEKLGLTSRVETVLGSATDFSLQSHERVLYLFNPFTGKVLQQCLENIEASYRESPGILIYVNPTESSQLERMFKRIESQFLQPGNCEVSYFELR